MLNLLKSNGYILVGLPRTGITTLQLLAKEQQNTEYLNGARIDEMLEADTSPLPIISKDNSVATLEGKRAYETDIEAGASLLKSILDTLKLGSLNVKTALDFSDKVVFSFQNITEDRIDLLGLDNFVNGALTKEAKGGYYQSKLQNGEIYVITNILKSDTFSIEALDKGGASLDLEAKFKELATGNLNIDTSNSTKQKITFKGAEKLIFGIKAVRLRKTGMFEFWKDYRFSLKPATFITVKSEEDFQAEFLEDDLV